MTCLVIAVAPRVAPAPRPGVAQGLEALRSGQFDRAQACFGRLAVESPASPEGPLLEALVLWWRLLDHQEDEALRRRMEARLEEAARRGADLAASGDEVARERGLTHAGIAQLLEAQSRAARKAHLSAASLARQGHRALSKALDLRPDSADALFAMGAYDYYAANLPLLVRGLRFLLFIPGGDEERGIARLERAGASGGTFGVEALMLLSHIFSGGFEDDMPRSLGYLEQAAARHPSSPLLALARADLCFRLGRLHEAGALSRSALDTIRSAAGFAPEIGGFAAYRLAASTLAMRDPLAALLQLESALGESTPETGPERRRWARLVAAAAGESGMPERGLALVERLALPDPEARSLHERLERSRDPIAAARALALADAAAGREGDASLQLKSLLGQRPGDPMLSYDLGRLLQRQGRYAEAHGHLEAAARAQDSPDLAGWSLIRLGWSLEREGRRGEAVDLYRRAAQVKRFTFQAVARDLAARPASAPPEG